MELKGTKEIRYAFMFMPQAIELDDGSWMASYPGDDWSVNAADKESAIEKLKEEESQRVRDPDRRTQREEIKHQHLLTPVDGVYAMDADLLHYLRELKVSRSELENAFEHAERSRAAGLTYTREDYNEEISGI